VIKKNQRQFFSSSASALLVYTRLGANKSEQATALEHAVAQDTVRNEYVFRATIHRWLAGGTVSSDVATLNEKIYAELFLTPSWDAWLGLRPVGAYSGIDNDGIRK
jgi:hypothetical protein